MLSLLHIENIAVIEEADITFGPGFNVLTGETGAGKSIVIDAISAILGERTYRDVIRTGTHKASVRAIFCQIPPLPWFQENGIAYDPQELLIQREIYADGKNICRVNGQLITVTLLKRLGDALINIHGQHDSQQLFDEANHLIYLDLFAQNRTFLTAYQEKYDQFETIRHEIKKLTMDEGEKLRRVESLQYQIREIEQASLQVGEDEQLEARRKVLQSSEKLIEGMASAIGALYGDEDSDGASGLLSKAVHALSRITQYDPELQEIYDRLNDLTFAAEDTAGALRDRMDSFTYSGDELEQIESRLDVLHRLKRKYGGNTSEILEYLERAKKELDQIEFADDRIEALKKSLSSVEKEMTQAALRLRESRKKAAKELEARLSQELAALDMARAQFVCQFEEQSPSANGMDLVRFLMTANIGEALKPMSKVASGGELARIMLAIKNVLAEQDHVGTLIFDEVDAGVSGRAAQKVAEKLKSVSRSKQVLCVTHLPQIAAVANNHLLIAKSEKNGRTYTKVTPLDRKGRAREIARIIGGAEITDVTLQSASEMLTD